MEAIRVAQLTKRYGDVLAVDAIDFTAPVGATIGLLGGNGAGKTTTIAMLLGLLVPTSGSIVVLGHDMARDRFAALARMNFSSPYVSLPSRLTVAQNLRVYGHLYGVAGIDARIDDRVYAVLTVDASVASRRSHGGTAPDQVRARIAQAKEELG